MQNRKINDRERYNCVTVNRISADKDYVQLSRQRSGPGKLTGYMSSKAVCVLNSRIEGEVEDILGGRNRTSNVLVAWRVWGVHGAGQRVKCDGSAKYRSGSRGMKTEKTDWI